MTHSDKPRVPVDHHYADLGDVTLHYVTAGTGVPIVMLHGWPQTWFMWRGVIAGLADQFQLVAVDLRGLGDSSRPQTGYDTTTVSNDVWRLMHDVLGHERFCVAAHDWGGPVAFALAAQHRAAIRAMAILDVPVPGDGTPLDAMSRWHFGFHALPDLPEALVAGREDMYLEFFYRLGGARPDAISLEAQQEYLCTYRQPGAMRAGFNYYRALRRDARDHQRYLADGKLDMPILVYGGGAPRAGRGIARPRIVATRRHQCQRRDRRRLRPLDRRGTPRLGRRTIHRILRRQRMTCSPPCHTVATADVHNAMAGFSTTTVSRLCTRANMVP